MCERVCSYPTIQGVLYISKQRTDGKFLAKQFFNMLAPFLPAKLSFS